jgi:hypothetical protein
MFPRDEILEVPLTPELQRAIVQDDPGELLALTSQYLPNFAVIDPLGQYPAIFDSSPSIISVCAFYGAIRCMEALLDSEADLLQTDRRNRRAYHFAAAGGVVQSLHMIVQQLSVRRGLSPFDIEAELLVRTADNYTILHYAAQFDRHAISNSVIRFSLMRPFSTPKRRASGLRCTRPAGITASKLFSFSRK